MYSKVKLNVNSCDCDCENNNQCSIYMNKATVNQDAKKKNNKKDCKSNGKKHFKTIEVRKEEVLAIRNRFPTKIPVIVQRFYKESYLPQLDKSKFLVPQEITMSQFQTIIRNRMRMNQTQALYLLVNDRSMLSLSLTLAEVYTEHAETDGFLYVTYASQEVFGDKIPENNKNIMVSGDFKSMSNNKLLTDDC